VAKQQKGLKIIYEPTGRAGEYAQLSANLYSGCTHGCLYCYVPSPRSKKTREQFHAEVKPRENVINLFENDAKILAANKDDREILFSFSCDPYPTIETEHNITRQAIEILKKNNLRFTILTKAGTRATKDFDLLKGYEKSSFGTTLVFSEQKDADIWEPNATPIEDRIKAINIAHEAGIKTWVSLEPVIDPDQALALIEKLYPIVDHWKVGKINYNKEIEGKVNWLKFREDVRSSLNSIVKEKHGVFKNIEEEEDARKKYYYLKRSLTAKEEIEDIQGRHSNILIAVPHGVYGDDDNAGEIAKKIANKLGCFAVINEKYQRTPNGKAPDPKNKIINLNRLDQIIGTDAEKEFLDKIIETTENITKMRGRALVIWLHGIRDESLEAYKAEYLNGRQVNILIGIGQGKIKLSAPDELVNQMYAALNEYDSNLVSVKTAEKSENYCATSSNNLTRIFLQKEYQNSMVYAMQLEIQYTGFRDYANIQKTADALSYALPKLMQPHPAESIQQVELAKIRCSTPEDKKYLFRGADFKDVELKKSHEKDIKSLADSIKKEGLLHPLILLKNAKGSLRLLCGYRRFQALKLNGEKKAIAKIYDENSLTEQQRLLISMTENGERKDFTSVEIADFLSAAKAQFKLLDKELGEEYASALGIGKSEKTINKYLQLAGLKKDSPEIITALQKGVIPLAVAAEVLAPTKNAADRNLFFQKIVLPFCLPRPNLIKIKDLLTKLNPELSAALARQDVTGAIASAFASEKPRAVLLEQLRIIANDPVIAKKNLLDESVTILKDKIFEQKEELKGHLTVSSMDSGNGQKEISLQIRLTKGNYKEMLEQLSRLAEEHEKVKGIFDQL